MNDRNDEPGASGSSTVIDLGLKREILSSEAELVQKINDALAATDHASECRFSGVYQLTDPDQIRTKNDGCNWSMGMYNSGGIPAEICGEMVRKVISEMQSKYNVDWP